MKIIFGLIFALLSITANAATTFTEFYCDFANGSNLNSGSTTNAAAVKTYTSAVVVGGWDSATGIFTVAAGNPTQDGVALGGWVSIYVTAGATVSTFVARVTGTNATTITVDLTAKSGTAPATDALGGTTLNYGGAWKGPNAAVSFPFGFVQATMTNLNTGVAQGIVPRVNLKNGATYAVTATVTNAIAGPIRWQGMTQWGVPGDLGKATIDCSTSGAGVTMFSASGSNNDFVDLIISNSGATTGTTTDGITSTGAENTFVRVVVHDIRRSGLFMSGGGFLIECEAYLCNKANAAAQCGINVSGSGSTAIRCNSHDNAGSNTSGYIMGNSCALINCISESNGRDGLTSTSVGFITIIGCDFYNNGASGIDLTAASASSATIQSCNFVKNTAWGIASSGSPIRNGNIVNCGLGSGTQVNGSGGFNTVTLGGVNETGTVTYAADLTPWVDPANGDFRINLSAAKAAGRGVFTETQASYSGTVGYPDIGAAQSGQQRSTTF